MILFQKQIIHFIIVLKATSTKSLLHSFSRMKKILFCADPHTNFDFLIKKVSTLMAKNTFDFILCVGEVLDVTNMSDAIRLKNFKIELPLPVYFIQSGPMASTLNMLYPDGGKILPNLYYLGRSGIKEIQGVTVAYLSGVQNKSDKSFYSVDNTEYSSRFYTSADVENLLGYTDAVDVLLTNEWPYESKFSDISRQPAIKSRKLNKIIDKLSPRYHFAGSEDIYYKRKEYLSKAGHASTFICVGSLHRNPDDNKEKYLHAIQIVPLSVAPLEKRQPGELEQSPYKQSVIVRGGTMQKELLAQNRREAGDRGGNQVVNQERYDDLKESPLIYFERFSYTSSSSEIQEFIQRWGETESFQIYFDHKSNSHKGCGVVKFKDLNIAKQCLMESGKYSLHGAKIRFMIKTEPVRKITDDKCWFCKDSRIFDKSLVFYNSENSYLALDKGPITRQHFLVVPNQHVHSSLKANEAARREIKLLIANIREWFSHQNKALIVFQRYLNLSYSINHCIIHVVPVEMGKVFGIVEKFEDIINKDRLPITRINRVDLDDYAQKGNYFYIEINERLYFREVKDRNFPIDFGRQLVCQMLERPERMNWKNCVNEGESQKQLQIYKDVMKDIGLK